MVYHFFVSVFRVWGSEVWIDGVDDERRVLSEFVFERLGTFFGVSWLVVLATANRLAKNDADHH